MYPPAQLMVYKACKLQGDAGWPWCTAPGWLCPGRLRAAEEPLLVSHLGTEADTELVQLFLLSRPFKGGVLLYLPACMHVCACVHRHTDKQTHMCTFSFTVLSHTLSFLLSL